MRDLFMKVYDDHVSFSDHAVEVLGGANGTIIYSEDGYDILLSLTMDENHPYSLEMENGEIPLDGELAVILDSMYALEGSRRGTRVELRKDKNGALLIKE